MPNSIRDIEDISIDEENKKGSSLLTAFIAFFIILIWLIIFALFIKLDIGSFGSGVLAPLIKDIPIINKVLPNTEIDMGNPWDEEVPYTSLAEAIIRIEELERENEILSLDLDADAKSVAQLRAEVERLRIFEENQLNFDEMKSKFDNEVVFAENAPSIEAYKEFYEMIDPTNAEEIYRQVVEQMQYTYGIKEKAEIYRKMEPKAAALVLETMTADLRAVSEILLAMRPRESAAILDEMDPVSAARITKVMLDMDEERLQ